MKSEKIFFLRDICLTVLIVAATAFIGVKYVLPCILPFIIAWAVAAITRRPSDFIAKKCKISKRFVRPVMSALIMIAIVGGFVFATVKIAAELWSLVEGLGENGSLDEIIDKLLLPLRELFRDSEIAATLEQRLLESLSGLFAGVLSSAAGVVSSVASAVPKILLFTLVVAMSAVYFAIDLDRINSYVYSLMPKSLAARIDDFKKNSSVVLVKYVRAYLLIMLLTFSVMFFGLSILRVRYSLLMALIIAVVDMLPVLGVGIVLIPWSVYAFAIGSTGLGIGLLILYAVGMIVRQAAEPKIIGKNLGIHPLLTLVLMYVGYTLFGIVGLLILPFFAVVLSPISKKNIPPRSESKSAEGSSDTAE